MASSCIGKRSRGRGIRIRGSYSATGAAARTRAAKAWATWHLSGNEWVQAAWRRQKAAKDFIPGGTTLNDFDLQVAKRIGRKFEVQGTVKVERWRAPVYLAGPQTVTAMTVQLIWRPQRKVRF